ncbi:hypothetical protein ACFQ3P_25020 [Paraburkholderia sabiae]|uniref:Uncharacterized protein n=1 Tax=Paraburkholderia sabiae TaxID=273251 RepID=A0ABU9QG35_9BURK|nr:hypothetical protein [Paraburkholderia sabiae]WJZ75108.1 hypothetical protein QEN71_04650 [Paraburkholderia sabiae]CAG9238946.1 hypothetical protein PSAB6_90040 [Paraburkholderia sabiae]
MPKQVISKKQRERGLKRLSSGIGLAKLHDRPVKFSTTIHGREKKKKRPEGRFLIQKP